MLALISGSEQNQHIGCARRHVAAGHVGERGDTAAKRRENTVCTYSSMLRG